MKKLFKISALIFILVSLIILIILLENDDTKTYAASSKTSDLQLMARAINGEARGEPYEGQVAVGAVILNRVKNPRFSKYNCWSNLRKRGFYCSSRWSNKCTNC